MDLNYDCNNLFNFSKYPRIGKNPEENKRSNIEILSIPRNQAFNDRPPQVSAHYSIKRACSNLRQSIDKYLQYQSQPTHSYNPTEPSTSAMDSETRVVGSKPEFESSLPVNFITVMSLVMYKAMEEKYMIEALHRGTSSIKNVHMIEQSSLFVDAEQGLKEIVLDKKEIEKLSKLGHFKIPLIQIFCWGVI